MSERTDTAEDGWNPWAASDGYSGFEVDDPLGRVAMAQTGQKDFAVTTSFRFFDEGTLTEYLERLTGPDVSRDDAQRMLDEARTISAPELMTDLASVPPFMAWFEAPYGRHTLAAILHDKLIEDEPNAGALHSDTLADSFFRDMMGVAGMPFFKRWLMWAAVAARSRWVAKGKRRVSLVVWGLASLVGIAMAVLAVLTFFTDVEPPVGWSDPWLWAVGAVVLPFVAAFLWGRQYGAGIVAAAAGLWLIPAAVIVLIGRAVYELSERLVSIVGPAR